MNTSTEYIEMCQKAEEIQKLKQVGRNWEKGDWYYNEFYGTIHVYNEEFKSVDGKPEDTIWLPCQDQLQAIGDFTWPQRIIEELRSFVVEFPYSPDFLYWYSYWETVWLAFVMKKRFGKVWNGEEWAKEKKSKPRVLTTSSKKKPKLKTR